MKVEDVKKLKLIYKLFVKKKLHCNLYSFAMRMFHGGVRDTFAVWKCVRCSY